MYRVNRLVRFVGWSLLLCLVVPTAQEAKASPDNTLRIAVVYRDGESGKRILGGVKGAVETYKKQDGKFKIEVKPVPYLDELSGIEEILKLFEDKSIHLILGPSDSGVFVNVEKRADYEKKASKPVVSPLVTSLAGNKEGDWRFRTNIDVEARVRAASDFLSHASYQAIGVLYSNNEFGQRAAKAFQNQLVQPDEDYLALPYEDNSQLRNQVRKILEKRPGAVGVFGRRYELRTVKRELEALNSGFFKYRPLLFSITDTRTLDLKGSYFVSLVGASIDQPENQSSIVWDEVRGLAYDTTWLVLKIAGQVQRPLNSKGWATSFRKRLFSYMLGPPQRETGFLTGMEFGDGKNLARPRVLTQTATVVQTAFPDRSWRDLGKLGDWIEIRERRYGQAIWFNIALVAVIALWLTLADIRRRQEIRSGILFFRRPVIALAAFNVLSAVATLIAVAEMGIAKWDSVVAALGVAIGHRAMLTTTIFETAQGRALGFGRLYERTLASINARIMTTLHESQSATINYVAYTNSLPNMHDLLINVYSFAQDSADSRDRIDSLEVEIARAKGSLAKQEVCARRLLQTMSWKQLQANRIIPEYIKQGKLIDPVIILRESVQHVLRSDDDLRSKVKSKIDEALARLKADSEPGYEAAVKELNDALENAETERGRLYCRLRWLFTQWGFSLKRIREEELLPENFRMTRLKLDMGWASDISARLRAAIDRKRAGVVQETVTEPEPGGSFEQEDERRVDQRVDIGGAAHLATIGEAGVSERKLEAAITDVSAGGACLLVARDAMDNILNASNTVSVHVLNGPLQGFKVEAARVYEIEDKDVIQLGIKWIGSSDEITERLANLAA
ncbi:ABC transporter substrate-binding protein [Kaarinaea lacus]